MNSLQLLSFAKYKVFFQVLVSEFIHFSHLRKISQRRKNDHKVISVRLGAKIGVFFLLRKGKGCFALV